MRSSSIPYHLAANTVDVRDVRDCSDEGVRQDALYPKTLPGCCSGASSSRAVPRTRRKAPWKLLGVLDLRTVSA